MQIDTIMLTGQADETIENSYNVNQLAEEKEKREYIALHPELAELIYELEDHPNLKGQIIIGLEHFDYAKSGLNLFYVTSDKIDGALTAIGDYGRQQERNKWRYQYDSKAHSARMDELFHRSANNGFENTREILICCKLKSGSLYE